MLFHSYFIHFTSVKDNKNHSLAHDSPTIKNKFERSRVNTRQVGAENTNKIVKDTQPISYHSHDDLSAAQKPEGALPNHLHDFSRTSCPRDRNSGSGVPRGQRGGYQATVTTRSPSVVLVERVAPVENGDAVYIEAEQTSDDEDDQEELEIANPSVSTRTPTEPCFHVIQPFMSSFVQTL